jgi:3-oxoacyl-[acyl-carrier-protein] synthase-3
MIKSKIISTGSYLPEKIYDNKYMESIVETTDEWITERCGIKERHIAADDELTSDLALKACIDALNNSVTIKKNDIDAIVLATTTPDRTFPSTATILQNKLEITNDNCFSFDVQAVCCGFVYAMDIADALIKSGKAKNILVVGADTMSKITNYTDRGTCILFGDGAGAVILQKSDDDSGILATSLHSDGKYFNLLKTSGGVSFNQSVGFIEMEGREVFKIAVNKMSECVLESIEKANLKMKDIDLLIPHQANQRIIDGIGKKLNIGSDRVISTIATCANTSGASIPLAIDYAVKNNKVKNGDIVVLEGLGGGLTWGSIVLRW